MCILADQVKAMSDGIQRIWRGLGVIIGDIFVGQQIHDYDEEYYDYDEEYYDDDEEYYDYDEEYYDDDEEYCDY